MKTITLFSLIVLSCSSIAGLRPDYIKTMEQTGSFKTFIKAIKRSGLEKIIRDLKNVTLYAPSDRAFEKIPTLTLDDLLNDKKRLSEIILYHVSPKKVKVGKLKKSKEVKTLAGKTIAISLDDGDVYLNDSKVVASNLRSSNGIIHGIDSILSYDEKTPSNTFKTEQNIDLKNYMGLWYEYARYENSFQRDCLGTTARYAIKKIALLKKDYVEVVNTCEKSNGGVQVGKAKAFVVDKETNATFKVSFVPFLNNFGLFAGDYNILKIGPSYEYALVGDKARSTFWILTREKEIPDSLYQELLDIAEEKGFRRELIKRSPVFTR